MNIWYILITLSSLVGLLVAKYMRHKLSIFVAGAGCKVSQASGHNQRPSIFAVSMPLKAVKVIPTSVVAQRRA